MGRGSVCVCVSGSPRERARGVERAKRRKASGRSAAPVRHGHSAYRLSLRQRERGRRLPAMRSPLGPAARSVTPLMPLHQEEKQAAGTSFTNMDAASVQSTVAWLSGSGASLASASVSAGSCYPHCVPMKTDVCICVRQQRLARSTY